MNPSPFNTSDSPLFRWSDPPTSREAAEQARVMAMSHREAVLEGVRHHPGLTYSELAYQIRMDQVEVMRRLNELVRLGLVVKGPIRQCEMNGHNKTTWYPKDQQ